MPQIDWVIEDYVYRVAYSGIITLADLQAGYDLSRQMLDQATHVLHLLVDLRAVEDIQPAPEEIRQLPNIYATTQHPRRGWTIHVGSNLLYRLITDTVAQDYAIQHHWCETEAEALAFLQTIKGSYDAAG